MKERLQLASNVGLFMFAALLLATLQTSLWFQMFGYFPGPALWIPVLIYIALNRRTMEAVIVAYLIAFVLSTMTAMPEGILMTVCVALALSAQVLKRRIYWTGASYFMMTCGLASLFFHLYHWGATFLFSDQPVTNPQISDWLIEALLTPLVAPPLLPIFAWFDRLTGRDLGVQASSSSSLTSLERSQKF